MSMLEEEAAKTEADGEAPVENEETEAPVADETADTGVAFTEDADEDGDDDYIVKKRRRKKRIIIISVIVIALALLLCALIAVKHHIDGGSAQDDMYTDVPVERRTVSNTITGSSYIEPNDSYNVISMRSGDITSDYISEGATVKKGDKLYQFDDEDARNQVTTAQNALTKAQQQYADAVKAKSQTVSSNNAQTQSARNAVQKALNSLNEADSALGDRYVSSEISGKVSAVYVSEGDNVQSGAAIADVYDDSTMKIRLPFNEFDAESVYEGAAAEVSVAGVTETIPGTVTEVSTASTASDAHTIVVYATIEVANPGALTADDIGSAVVNDVACADTAAFEYGEKRTITAETAGTLRSFSLSVGDAVYTGQQIGLIESEQLENAYDNARLSYDDALLALEKQVLNNDTYSQDSNIKNAQLALEDARIQLKNAQETVEDFVVEAPIDGTVVTKNAKAGDTIDSTNGANTDPLCVIYDLSCLKFSIDVDETEVALVKTGQKVTVTADAAEGEFEGEVVKVPVNGVNQNGVTTYTIDVKIQNYGDLLPGMNVDAEIVVEEAENVLTVPMNSVNRGDIVFVKDDGTPHENDVTDMLTQAGGNDNGGRDGKGAAPEGSASPNGSAAPMDGRNGGNNAAPRGSAVPMDGRDSGNNSAPNGSAAPMNGRNGGSLTENLPKNIEVPEGYRAIAVETGLNDSDYIEIKSGLKEGDMVRTLNTLASSEGALDDDMAEAFSQMGGGMGGNRGGMGGPGGGMGGPGGGMGGPGGGR